MIWICLKTLISCTDFLNTGRVILQVLELLIILRFQYRICSYFDVAYTGKLKGPDSNDLYSTQVSMASVKFGNYINACNTVFTSNKQI